MNVDIGNLCTNCGVETSELAGAYSSGADATLLLGWQYTSREYLEANGAQPFINVHVNGLLCPDCQTSSKEEETWHS
jgi:hypothetical protein